MKKTRQLLQSLGADACGILTVTDPCGRLVIFTAASFAKVDLELAPLIPAIIAAPDAYIARPDKALAAYAKQGKDGTIYIVQLSGYNVNQLIALHKAEGESASAALDGFIKSF